MKNTECAIIVSSCDAFQDVWPGFFALLFRYWPDCPFPVYLISNEKSYPDSRVQTICTGLDRGWATNTKQALKEISAPYIFFFLEDCYIQKTVDSGHVLELLEFLKARHAATIRLLPSPPPDESFQNTLNLGLIRKNADYRVSLCPGIWDKNALLALIKEGENPWQMESEGTARSRAMNQEFFCSTVPVINYPSGGAIVRGKWTWEGTMLCRRERIHINTKKRGIDYGRKWRSLKDQARKAVKRFLRIR